MRHTTFKMQRLKKKLHTKFKKNGVLILFYKDFFIFLTTIQVKLRWGHDTLVIVAGVPEGGSSGGSAGAGGD